MRTVSAERVRDEVLKTLRHGRGRGLRLLRDAGLLAIVLPEIDAMRGVTQGAEHHPEGDVFVHTCLVVDGVDVAGVSEEEATILVLGALLHDVAKPPTRAEDPDGVPDIDAIRRQCDALVAAEVAAATPADREEVYTIARAMLAKAEG